tara:strand:+ start:139 stop:2112 length:1974 start_codon:yes stop_codon:yes gene_type:complete
MVIPKTNLLFALFYALAGHTQMPDNFGNVTNLEKEMVSYEKDPTAKALVLFERGDNYFKLIDRYILLVKEYHTKIKILDEQAFDHGTIEIPLYHSNNGEEKISKIKAITHNGESQYNVLPSEIFTSDVSEHWRQTTFTFPKMQKGSILEYSYTITTPYYHNFTGWDFQSDLPKMYSEFNASIPGNYLYNRTLVGYLTLDVNEAKIKKECFYIDGFDKMADCEVLKYTMKDIPAFKDDNEFMLSKQNYISRLDFELSQYNRFDGTTDKYTKTWKDVDKEFRTDADIGRQLSKKGFFEKNVPEKLLTEGDALTRAKNIYKFVKEHYTWTGDYGVFGKENVKDAFDKRQGSVGEINMSLINLLNAAEIKTNLMLLSTREQGLPKKTHPVISDFNYFVALVNIDGQDYLLDATDKHMPFGMLPFRALNHYGRVMDFDNESYWYDIKPETNNKYQIRATVKFDVAAQKAIGILDVLGYGYTAVTKNKMLKENTEEQYLNKVEQGIAGNFEVTDYQYNTERSNDKKTVERFSFEISDILKSDRVYFNPFLIRFFDENPFQMEERQYPIDFGYPSKYVFQISIEIPEGYEVVELPAEITLALSAEKLVTFQLMHQANSKAVLLSFDLIINRSYFAAQDYSYLKDLFKQVVNTQKNTLVVLKKIQ